MMGPPESPSQNTGAPFTGMDIATTQPDPPPLSTSAAPRVDTAVLRPNVDLSPIHAKDLPVPRQPPHVRVRPLTLPMDGSVLKRDYVLGEFVAVETKVDALENDVNQLHEENKWLKNGLDDVSSKLNTALEMIRYIETRLNSPQQSPEEDTASVDDDIDSTVKEVKVKSHPKITVQHSLV